MVPFNIRLTAGAGASLVGGYESLSYSFKMVKTLVRTLLVNTDELVARGVVRRDILSYLYLLYQVKYNEIQQLPDRMYDSSPG